MIIKQGHWIYSTKGGSYLTGKHVMTIMFNHYYKSPPNVHISLVSLSAVSDEPCFHNRVQKVYNDKFELYIDICWRGMWNFGVEWTSIGY